MPNRLFHVKSVLKPITIHLVYCINSDTVDIVLRAIHCILIYKITLDKSTILLNLILFCPFRYVFYILVNNKKN